MFCNDYLIIDKGEILSEDEYLILEKRINKIKYDKKIREDKYKNDIIKHKIQNAINTIQNIERIRKRKDRLGMIKNDYNANYI